MPILATMYVLANIWYTYKCISATNSYCTYFVLQQTGYIIKRKVSFEREGKNSELLKKAV